MRRALTIIALLTAALAAAPATVAAQPPPASVRVVACSFEEHEATFRGSMRRVVGSDRMAMRFTLMERTGTGGFKPVRAPGLGRWRRAREGVVSFGFRQVVQALPENAAYRMRVDFRWFAPDGGVLLHVQRNSATCRQFAALPNLRVELLGTGSTKLPGVVRYRVLVVNAGKDAVTAPVRLSVDGGVIDTASVADLLPGESREIGLRGPSCASLVAVEADPDELIVESSEDDNTDELACPISSGR
jgi:CARDB